MRDDLPDLKGLAPKIIACEGGLQGGKCATRHENKHVDDEQIFSDNR